MTPRQAAVSGNDAIGGFAVARLGRASSEFFDGTYRTGPSGIPLPRTTTDLEQARSYDDLAVADLVVGLFNFLDGSALGHPVKIWRVVKVAEVLS